MCFVTCINRTFKHKMYTKWPFKNTNLLWESISKVATEDLVVYKIGNTFADEFVSFYHSFNYIPNKVYSVKPEITIHCISDIHIHQGFHSYKHAVIKHKIVFTSLVIPLAEKVIYIPGTNNDLCLAKFIIPKGSRYIENDNNEIVSDKILFSEIII